MPEPTSNGERLTEALKEAFPTTGTVALNLEPPSVFTVPSVVVTPGDPFLTPGNFGGLEEHWEVYVVVSTKEVSMSVNTMRDLSTKVREAISKAGGLWRETSGPRVPDQENARGLVFVVNRVEFKTKPIGG